MQHGKAWLFSVTILVACAATTPAGPGIFTSLAADSLNVGAGGGSIGAGGLFVDGPLLSHGQLTTQGGLVLMNQIAPDSSTTPCTTGAVVIAGGFIYSCVASNSWARVAIASW